MITESNIVLEEKATEKRREIESYITGQYQFTSSKFNFKN